MTTDPPIEVYDDDGHVNPARYRAWYAATFAQALSGADADWLTANAERHHAARLAGMLDMSVASLRWETVADFERDG